MTYTTGYQTGPVSPEETYLLPYYYCPICGTPGYYFREIPCGESEPIVPGPIVGETGTDQTGSEQGPNATYKIPIPESTSAQQMEGTVLMVLPQKNYQEMEFNEPKAVFESYGLTVKVASKTAGTATGMSGENATIDLPLKDVDLSQYQAVVFVGGMGIDDLKLYEDQEYISLAKKAKQAGLVVGAICLAPKILANADLLKDRNATASDPDYLKSKGAKVQDLDVVRDGYIITGSGPDASQRFGEEIVATIRERNAPISQEDLTGALRVPLEGVTPEEGEEGNLSSETVTSKPVDLGPKYKCTKCSYVYDPAVGDPDNGIPAGTPFSKLPSTWKCPWCGASKSQFRKA